jgi:ribosomal subunit interface protein
MEITVQGKQMDVGDALTDHVKAKLTELDQKYFNTATDAAVTFSKEGHGTGMFRATITFNITKNLDVVTEAVEADPYAAFDSASERAAKRLRRYKERIRNHKSRSEKSIEEERMKAKAYTLVQDAMESGEEEEEVKDPAIVAEIQTTILKMSVADAVMRMELSGRNALMFRNASNSKLSMVYMRRDGNVGWMEPDDE